MTWLQQSRGMGERALTRLIVEEPEGLAPVHDHVTLGHVCPDGAGKEHPPAREAGGMAFKDGSCANPKWASLARTGWGCAVYDANSELKGGGYGTVPSAGRQSAPSGEHYAVLALCEDEAEQGVSCPPIYSDCALVVNAAQRGSDATEAASTIYAGWWREITKANGGVIPKVTKV